MFPGQLCEFSRPPQQRRQSAWYVTPRLTGLGGRCPGTPCGHTRLTTTTPLRGSERTCRDVDLSRPPQIYLTISKVHHALSAGGTR